MGRPDLVARDSANFENSDMISKSIIAMRQNGVREDAISRALYLHSLVFTALGDDDAAAQEKAEAVAIRKRLKGIEAETDDNLLAYTRLVFYWDW